MDILHMLGLLLLLLSIRNSMPDETVEEYQYDEDDDYDESYYDFNSSETKTEMPITTTLSTTSKVTIYSKRPTTTTHKIIQMDAVLPEITKIVIKCPNACQCNNQFTFVNCSNRNIESVPNEFPEPMQGLDLSNNLITKFKASDFENCTSLKELLLNNNKLTSINFKNISGLIRLERISLANNHITKLDSNAFSNLIALKKLNLNNNPIVISRNDGSFLNQRKLEELYMNGCRMRNLHDDMFQNLSGLITLDLGNNDFDKKINTQAFIPMKNLERLQLPELERDTISELCKILTSIDLINFKKFDISCFELVSGSSFEESTITAKPSSNTENVTKPTKDPLNPSPGGKSISTMEIALAVNNSLAKNTSFSNEETTGADDSKVVISSQAINYILIGIIIVAVVGIIIGIICRRDICGIKTKMCRTKRPPPNDQVTPAEEIPLNKV